MRRATALLVVALALATAGCGEDGGSPAASPSPSAPASAPSERPAAGDHRLSLRHDGTDRTYLLHAPPGYDPGKRVPLVIALHFYPGSGEELRDMVALDAKADRENFLVAYPDGQHRAFNALICCGSADDVGFLRTLAEHLVGAWGADPDRVYLTGISNGGDMSFRAAVESDGLFAAIGVVSGGYLGPRTEAEDYVPKRPVSVITFVGGQDVYAGDFEKGLRAWQRRLGCRARPAAAPAPKVTRTDARCADGSDVTVYRLAEMSHSWPGAPNGQLADPTAGVVATDLMWDFFAKHPRRS